MESRGFFVNRRGLRLFYCAHGRAATAGGWIFCNPFLEEKAFSQSVYVALARRMAGQGHFVLRFDYTGDGDSEGDVASTGLNDWVQDVIDAAAFADEQFGLKRPRLFGLRLGVAVALLAAPAVHAVQVLAWEPIVRGEAYLQELLMLNVTTQLATYKHVREDRKVLRERLARGESVNVAGHEIGQRMAESLETYRLADAVRACGCAVGIVTALKTEGAAPARELQALNDPPMVTVAGRRVPAFWYEPRFAEFPPAAMWEASLTMLAREAPEREAGSAT